MTVKKLQWENIADVQLIERHLKADEVIVGTSDTVLGLLAAVSQKTFEALKTIKAREDKPFLILVSSWKIVDSLSSIKNPLVSQLIKDCWPGPLTLILPVKPEVPSYITGGRNTVAVRYPQHAGLQTLLKSFDMLFSTSANLAGKPVPNYLEDVDLSILKSCAAIIDDAGEHKEVASTILDCTGDTIFLVRAGAFPVEKLEEIIGYSLIVEKKH